MFQVGSTDVVQLLAAGGPREFLIGAPWPLHAAFLELAELSRQSGCGLPYGQLSWTPHPDVQRAVPGVGAAVAALASSGVLVATGTGLGETWTTHPDRLVQARKDLMRLQPADASRVHLAARRWRTLAETSLMNWRAASSSVVEAV